MIKLSVIIPTFNRLGHLKACVEALRRQTCGPDKFEVIVVVDGSTDGSREYLDSFQKPVNLRCLFQENHGREMARNAGAEIAGGERLLFIDDDIIAEETLVEEHLRLHSAAPNAVGIGHMFLEPDDHSDWYGRCFANAWNRRYEQLGERPVGWQDFYAGNVSVPRPAFLSAGGFSAELPVAQDIELGQRLVKAGLQFSYLPAARSVHDDCKTGRTLVAQAHQYGISQYHLTRRHPDLLADLASTYHGLEKSKLLLFRVFFALGLPARLLMPLRVVMPSQTLLSRLHKIIQQYSFWSGARQAMNRESKGNWRVFSRGLPVLMYHAFSDAEEGAGHYTVSRRNFEKQMAWLNKKGYRGISLQEFAQQRVNGRLPGEKTVILTVDDGYRDFLQVALPVLKKYNFTATVFVVTGLMDRKNSWDGTGELSGHELFSWDESKRLVQEGIEIGAHTVTHARLPTLEIEKARQEICGSKADIKENLGFEAGSFAYPYGLLNADVRDLVAKADYSAACTVNDGLNHPAVDDCLLRRTEVNGRDSLIRFVLKVRTGITRHKLKNLAELI